MGKVFHKILDWSEVWALLIPLIFLLWKKNKDAYLKPVRIYILTALVINLAIDLIAEFKGKWGLKPGDFFWNNNFLYNISSVLRLFLFAWFFILLRQRFMERIKWVIPFTFLAFVVINFSIYETFIPQGDYEGFSSRLLATESALLLFYCLQYFIFLILEDKAVHINRQKGFWVITGLSIYVAISFFIFLFYYYLIRITRDFAVTLWDVHNIAFIIFCIFMAIEFNRKHE